MKPVVVALSGSLRPQSFTDKMLDLCLEGMGDGLEVLRFYPHKMKIGPCTGCWTCWRQSEGKCVQQDDFEQIANAYVRAGYFLIGAPLYYFSFPATVKNVIDRFFCFLEPGQRPSARGGTEHPKRGGHHPRAVLISSCGFPELETFDLLRGLFRRICEDMEWRQAGEILVPAAGAANVPHLFDRKLDLIRQAGRELTGGQISPQTTQAIAQPVMSIEDYRAMCTASFSGLLGKARAAAIGMKAAAFGSPSAEE